eukprot:365397-Chlamydomonas_euryale.AAC.6
MSAIPATNISTSPRCDAGTCQDDEVRTRKIYIKMRRRARGALVKMRCAPSEHLSLCTSRGLQEMHLSRG